MILFVLLLAVADISERFTGSNWPAVSEAKQQFEERGEASVPVLIRLMHRTEVVPLTDTMDLIYPGAKMFYGHGGVVDYDIDWLSVRAGWALEEITFEDFGFSEQSIREADLLAATRNGKTDVPLAQVTGAPADSAVRARRRAAAVTRADAWYAAHQSGWSRLEGLKAALRSGNSNRELKALQWLRFGETRIRGFSHSSYESTIKPLVVHLAKHGDADTREQATLLLGDKSHY